jgi:hypothetical protein
MDVVAQIVFSPEERARVESILEEFDPAEHELTRRFADRMSEQEWKWVTRYLRRELRALLEIGVMLRAVTALAHERGHADRTAVRRLLRDNRTRNFGLPDDADAYFNDLCMMCEPTSIDQGDPSLWRAGDALLELAADRMFDTLGEEYAELLDSLDA